MRIHGRHGSVEIGSPAALIGSVSKWTLNQAKDFVEVTCFGDENKAWVVGLKDISGQLSFVYNLDPGSPASGDTLPLIEATEGDDPVMLKLVPDTNNATHFWSGQAYLDLSTIDVDVKGAVVGTSNFKGSGSWTRQ
jgi:hypothetical protein